MKREIPLGKRVRVSLDCYSGQDSELLPEIKAGVVRFDRLIFQPMVQSWVNIKP